MMSEQVDSFKFVSGFTRRILKNWIKNEPQRDIPWTPLQKPISKSTVAIISTAAVALKEDKPFDQQGERDNPWWGDPSYRILPRTTTEKDVDIYHLHIETKYPKQDLNCVFPLQRLLEMEATGVVGRSAPSHYSTMGYILKPQTLLEETTPAIIDSLRTEEVDLVLLIPV